MKRWKAIGRAGGDGTFWQGYEYTLGEYRWHWLAWLRAWWHVRVENPWRAARIELQPRNRKEAGV